jgi:hypothetical protein
MSKHNAKHLADWNSSKYSCSQTAQFLDVDNLFPSKFKTHWQEHYQQNNFLRLSTSLEKYAMKTILSFPMNEPVLFLDLSSMVPNLFLRKAHSFVDEI